MKDMDSWRTVDIAEMSDRKKVQNFYSRWKESKRGFPTEEFILQRERNLVDDEARIMKRSAEYFEKLLNVVHRDEENQSFSGLMKNNRYCIMNHSCGLKNLLLRN